MDTDTRRKKQQALITELLERKIRLHAQHLYDQRGQQEGSALQDWVAGARAETLLHLLGSGGAVSERTTDSNRA